LVAHGAGSGEYEDKQSRRCRVPIIGFAAARALSIGGVPPNGFELEYAIFMFFSDFSRGDMGRGNDERINRLA